MKKNKAKKNNKLVVPLIVILVAILAISAVFLIYVYTQNYINVEYIDKSSNKIKSDNVTSVTPIIMNNVVIGGMTDKGEFINKDNMYFKANLSKGSEIDMYNIKGKVGTYEIYSVNMDDKRNLLYAVPLKDLGNQEYIAISKSDNNIAERVVKKITPSKKDEESVKKALGKYRLLNNTVKVNEVYEGYLTPDQKTRVISATSSGKNTFGVYSVLIAVKGNKSKIIKYSYVKNTKSSIDWPVYSIKFVCDFNNDKNYEIVIQETRELTIKYSVLELKKDKYYEVIGLKFKI